ncbi:enolase (DUF1399) isoform X2 [Tasmannia lanceolata]
MPWKDSDSGVSDDSGTRNISGISDQEGIGISIDLVSASRRHLAFLRTIADSPWLHRTPTLLQSITRYEKLWMPLISELSEGSKSDMLLPPFDVQWVWHCHCLNPVSYRQYCEAKFSKLIEKPVIFDEEIEDYAVNRCREIWNLKYPFEPFDVNGESNSGDGIGVSSLTDNDLFAMVSKQGSLYSKFSRPFLSEIVHLIAAKHRYKGFLYMLKRFRDGYSRLVPTSDILIMWLTHQSFPSTYEGDMKEMEGDLERVVGVWDPVKEEDAQMTKTLWEEVFDQPYERAGATFDGIFSSDCSGYWEASDSDVNRKYKGLEPRFLLEVCLFVKGKWDEKDSKETKNTFLRLRTVRCHMELKIDKPISDMSSQSWQKRWQLFCEFSTRGVVVEVRQQGSGCLRNSKLHKMVAFSWNDLLRAPSLTLEREVGLQMRVIASITPPVQAPYLLKCVPDRVTDDKGAMISDVILKMNRYHPQEGRWLSRTVLDHAGRECFIIRIRVGGGFWRRGAETPTSVKWEDRIIEIREGSWSYVAGSIGTAPEKVVGTATPKDKNPQDKKATWSLSTGYVLTIQWEGGLNFHLQNENPDESSVR